MPNISKQFIAEQVLRLLKAGDPSVGSRVHIDELKIAVGQACSNLLKVEHFSVNMPDGQTIPQGYSLATYDAIPVVTYKNVSKSTLPVSPVSLPRAMGVFHIGHVDDVYCQFIPYQPGQFSFIKTQPLISDLFDMTGYEVSGMDVIYSRDLPAADPAITTVLMKLVIMDISKYTDYQALPVPADMQWPLIQEVYKMFSSEQLPKEIAESGRENK